MVYYSGGKMARNAASIVNRPNCGGSAKKGGLAPSIGFFMSSNPNLIRAANTQYGLVCIPNHTVQTQVYGYRATHTGRMG
jgi:hypothetical protein